jgi:hypothetical protein
MGYASVSDWGLGQVHIAETRTLLQSRERIVGDGTTPEIQFAKSFDIFAVDQSRTIDRAAGEVHLSHAQAREILQLGVLNRSRCGMNDSQFCCCFEV